MEAVARLVAGVTERLDELAEESTRAILAEIRGYRARADDPRLRDDVRAHVRAHYDAVLATFGEGRPVEREDLIFIRAVWKAWRKSATETSPTHPAAAVEDPAEPPTAARPGEAPDRRRDGP